MEESNRLPPLRLPLIYHAFGTLCFALALLGVIVYSQDLTGFYYHPHILALTHLITLGWITGNILGTFYIIAPMALLSHLKAGKLDGFAFFLYAGGVAGMVAHFWRDLPFGMAWSATCAYAGVLIVGIRIIRAIFSSKTPAYVRFHILLGFCNFFLAGAWGVLLGFHKVYGFLPTSSSPNVIAHVHLAGVGWASMIVFGVAYRLLPMFLPSEPAKGKGPWVSLILLETGVLGFFGSALLQSSWIKFFAALIAGGILLFFVISGRQSLRRKPAPPPELPKPDFMMLHAPFAFSCLFFCIVIGFVLLNSPANEKTLTWALAYAVLGFIGFLSQIVTGLKPKILSVFTWYHAFHRNGPGRVERPVDMPVRVFQITVFGLWVVGLPLLIYGIVDASAFLIRCGATLLLAALVIATAHEWTILGRIFKSKARVG